MGTQVSYPGIYIREFTPGAPIQSVGTSTGAFIGTASMGPANQPTFITSWDEFQNVFGGFIAEPPNMDINQRSWLAPAVWGFFQNGGTGSSCYVVRAVAGSTSLNASVGLPAQLAGPPQPDLIVTAIAEGLIGNAISLTVNNSSRLASMLAQGGPTLQATGPLLANASTIDVSLPPSLAGLALPANMAISVTQGTMSEFAVVKSWAVNPTTPPTGTITLVNPLANSYSAGPPTAQIAPALQATAIPGARQLMLQVVLPPAPTTFVLGQALPAGALIQISDGTTSELLTVASSSGNTITLATPVVHNTYASAPIVTSLEFDLVVTAATTETWPQLSMSPLHPGYWQTIVKSQLITLSLPPTPPNFPAPPPVPNPNPEPGSYNLSGGQPDDRASDIGDINTSPTTYLDFLKPLQDVNIVAIPGNTNANAQQALITHCETLFNRFAVLDAAPDSSPGYANLRAQYGQVRTPDGFAAIYFPWIQVVNPVTKATEYWPPSGHVMGIYAQTDQAVGVWKAPANVPIAGALGLQSLLSNADQGPLNLLGINVLRVFPEQSQPLVWGARTTSTDSDWQYINIRRFFIFLEQSIEQGIRWAVFQPNNQALWGSLKRTITEFLNRYLGGGIINFYVRIDSTLNPPAVQALGQLYIEVGIQPAYPAEFIILRIGIWQGGSSITEG